MDTLGPDYGQVHFIVDRGAERGSTVYLHRGQLLDDDVVEVGSFRVTSMARTVADVACAADFAGALTVVDCGLRRGVPRAQLEGLAAGLAGSSGIANFRNALGHAHEKAETAGESLSRTRMIEMGDIPLPRLQHQFISPAGSFLARSDFDCDGKVIGEFDGRGKYTADGQEAGASWHAERERHNRLLQHRQGLSPHAGAAVPADEHKPCMCEFGCRLGQLGVSDGAVVGSAAMVGSATASPRF